MPVCPSCARSVPEDASFCGFCGANMVATPAGTAAPPDLSQDVARAWACGGCGADNEPGDKYCSSCGSLRPGPPTDIAVQPPQSAADTAVMPVPPRTPQGPVCPSCGLDLEPDSAFCPSCGAASAEASTLAISPDARAPLDDAPDAPLPTKSRRPVPRSRVVVLAAAVIVIAVVIAGAAYFFLHAKPKGSPAKQPAVAATSTPATQDSLTPSASPTLNTEMVTYLQSLAGLIRQAGHGRHAIDTATAGFTDHTISAAAAAAMIQSGIDNRNSVMETLSGLSSPAGSKASSCRNAFVKAMRYSILSDEHYRAWVMGTGEKKAALPYDTQANQWKASFISQYDLLAKTYGLRHDWAPADI